MFLGSFFGQRSSIKMPMGEISYHVDPDSIFPVLSVTGLLQLLTDTVRVIKGEPLYAFSGDVRFGQVTYRQDSWQPEVQTLGILATLATDSYFICNYLLRPSAQWLTTQANSGLDWTVNQVKKGGKWLALHATSYRLGLSFDDLLKLNKQVKVSAYEHGLSFEEALRFENNAQLKMYEYGLYVEEALRFENNAQFTAYELGASVDNALRFKTTFQVDAYKSRAPIEDALKFDKLEQLLAYDNDVPIEDALRFESSVQLKAHELGASVEDALRFNNTEQVNAYGAGVPIDDALNIDSYVQVLAYKVGVPVDYVKFNAYF